jgi:glycosyltransferase involved in cell wall biosynthesis
MHEENGVTAPITVQPYGHDLSWVATAPPRAPSDVLRLGYVGQIVPSKGVHLILEAVHQLSPELQRRVAVLIYGNVDKAPAYGARLKSLATTLPDVRFMGTYAHEDSGRVYASFDALVVPSLWYDFPLVVHEALAMRAPVLASNLGGLAESVEPGVNGLLFEPGSAPSLAGVVTRLLTERRLLASLAMQKAPVRTIGQAGHELVQAYVQLTPASRTLVDGAVEYGQHLAADWRQTGTSLGSALASMAFW